MSKQLISWAGPALDPSGYGEATRNYLEQLSIYDDVHLRLRNKNFWSGTSTDLGEWWNLLEQLHHNDFDVQDPYIFVQHLTPEQYLLGPGNCKYHIGMTTFETSSIPDGWQHKLRMMDEIWTFSRWARQRFIEAGIRRPITVIPHGVDTGRFNTIAGSFPQVEQEIGSDRFVFGSNFDWTERKNPRALLTAFLRSFTKDDQVALVIKTYYQYPHEHSRLYIHSYINDIKRSLGVTEHPPIVVMTDIMGQRELPRFYGSLNAYVLPSRGEGWGLTFSEAMASGLPTIGVNWSGNTEFMTDDNSLLVKNYSMRDITPLEATGQPQYIGHQWADCDVEELGNHMRKLFEDPGLCAKLGSAARSDMVKRFSWRAATGKMHARLRTLAATL